MPRTAFLFVPDLSLAAALRTEPELRGQPLAITDASGRGQRETVISGWLQGLTVAQAQAVRPDLVVRSVCIEGMNSAQQALLDVASSISPRRVATWARCA